MSIWKSFQTRMDAVVDRYFDEPVRLVPWIGGKYSEPGTFDSTRVIIDTRGIYVQAGAAITGEGGTMGGGMDLRVVTQDVWLSIVDERIVKLRNWKKGDRVYFSDRNEWFEISWPDTSATGRPNIHLIRLQDNEVGDMDAYLPIGG